VRDHRVYAAHAHRTTADDEVDLEDSDMGENARALAVERTPSARSVMPGHAVS
jgi:hypothetical protein